MMTFNEQNLFILRETSLSMVNVQLCVCICVTVKDNLASHGVIKIFFYLFLKNIFFFFFLMESNAAYPLKGHAEAEAPVLWPPDAKN